jgi:hypothetical protein
MKEILVVLTLNPLLGGGTFITLERQYEFLSS